MNRIRITTVRLASITLLGTIWAAGGMAGERAPLTLSAAFERAIDAHPALQAARLERQIAGKQRDAAALPPVTTLGIEVENFAGSGTVSGFDATETTLLIAKKFERGDKAQLRQAAGERRVDLAALEEWATRLEVEANAERLFFRILAAQSGEQNAAEAVALAEQTLAIVERRVEIGRSPGAESHTAFIRLARARLLLEQAMLSSAIARNTLALQWGASTADFEAVAGDLMRMPQIPDMAAVHRRIDGNPDLVRLANEAELAVAQQQLAAAQAKTDVELSAGIRYLSLPNDAAFVVGVSVPIGQGRRARPLGDAARARRLQIPLETEQRRRELAGVATRLHAEIERQQLALRAIRDDMVPRANKALDLYRKGYELGGYSLLELTEAQNMALGLRWELIDVAEELHVLRIELTRLTGGSQDSGAST